MQTIARIVALLACACVTAVAPHASAADTVRPPAHVEIILDTSGSMSENDKERLSVLAAMLFTDLASPSDAVGILGMSQRNGSYSLRSLEPVAGGAKSIKKAFRDVEFYGPTDCSGPLQAAGRELAGRARTEPNAEQFVIFLSDGICPDDVDGGDALGEAARELAGRDVRIFTIGLFPDEGKFDKDPTTDLTRMARMTRGEFFRARTAGDVPARFADILGRILGSQAQVVAIGEDGRAQVDVDGYLVDASLVLTSSGAPAVVSRAEAPNGRVMKLPTGRPPFTHLDTGLSAAADTNGEGQFYEIVRLEEPTSGRWSIEVDGPPNTNAILIQNYALDPVLELPEKQEKYKIGEEIFPIVYLRGPDGNRIADRAFLDKVSFTLEYESPSGKRQQLELEQGDDGASTGTLPLEEEGAYALNARAEMKAGGLDKETETITVETMALQLVVAPNQGPIDFGTVKAGERSEPQTVDLSSSKIGSSYALTLSLEMKGDGDIDNVPTEAPISPKSQTFDVAFAVDTDHPGGAVDGNLEVSYGKQRVRIPVSGEVTPLTFWERYGKLVMAFGAGILGLALLLFIIMGFVRPHNFARTDRIKYAEEMKKLRRQKPVPIRSVRGTRSGFYRNAKLHVGGDERPYLFPVGSEPLATLEAVGPGRIELRAGPGVELRKVNDYRPERENDTVIEEGVTSMHTGTVYRVGKFLIERS